MNRKVLGFSLSALMFMGSILPVEASSINNIKGKITEDIKIEVKTDNHKEANTLIGVKVQLKNQILESQLEQKLTELKDLNERGLFNSSSLKIGEIEKLFKGNSKFISEDLVKDIGETTSQTKKMIAEYKESIELLSQVKTLNYEESSKIIESLDIEIENDLVKERLEKIINMNEEKGKQEEIQRQKEEEMKALDSALEALQYEIEDLMIWEHEKGIELLEDFLEENKEKEFKQERVDAIKEIIKGKEERYEAALEKEKEQREAEERRIEEQRISYEETSTSSYYENNYSESIEPTAETTTNYSANGDIVSLGLAQVGKPYIYATRGPNSFDCSGLTHWLYKQIYGITLSASSAGQTAHGYKVSKGDLRPGDLLFFATMGGGRVSHVGMYIGDGQMVHASTPERGVVVDNINSNYWVRTYVTARRIVD